MNYDRLSSIETVMLKIKKQKIKIKKCVMKRKHKFADYKHCLEPTQARNGINVLEKNTLDVDSIREILKNSKKKQQ